MILYTLEEFEKDIAILVELIQKSGIEYTAVFGVPGIGTMVAVVLAEALHLPIRSQDFLRNENIQFQTKDNVLIVDVRVDHGINRDQYSHHDFACLHVSFEPESENEINYFAKACGNVIDYSCLEPKEITESLQDSITSITKAVDEIISEKWYVDSFDLHIKRKQ